MESNERNKKHLRIKKNSSLDSFVFFWLTHILHKLNRYVKDYFSILEFLKITDNPED